MKIELQETNEIKIIPETIQDKVWLTLFMRDAIKECSKHMELSFEKSPDADWKGGGYADSKKVGVFTEGEGKDVEFSEITELSIFNHDI